MTTDQVKEKIAGSLPDARVEVEDMTGTGDHFRVSVTSTAFEGKTLVQQHQLIYKAVDGHLADGSIHALSIKTQTP